MADISCGDKEYNVCRECNGTGKDPITGLTCPFCEEGFEDVTPSEEEEEAQK